MNLHGCSFCTTTYVRMLPTLYLSLHMSFTLKYYNVHWKTSYKQQHLWFSQYCNQPRCNSYNSLFADDCVVYRPIANSADTTTLQNDLNLIVSWCDKWLMSLNIKKTSLVSFHRRPRQQSAEYTLFGTAVSPAESYKYLGVTFSNNISWSAHVTNIANSANCTLGFLRRHLRLAPPSVKLISYVTLVRPKLEYACSVWDPHQSHLSNILESIQNRVAHFIYSEYTYDSSVSKLKTRAHLSNLELRRPISRLCLFHKFYHASIEAPAILPVHRSSSRTNHSSAVYPPPAQSTAHLRSFFVTTARDWNRLPTTTVHHSDPHQFKIALESLFFIL